MASWNEALVSHMCFWTCALATYNCAFVLPHSNILYLLYHLCTVPSQVTGMAVSKAVSSGKPALRVTWTTLQSDVTISQHQVEYRRKRNNWRAAESVFLGPTTSTLLEALDAGTVYKVRVRAVSAIGNGTWSRVESETTYTSELCSELLLSGSHKCVPKEMPAHIRNPLTI